MRTSRTHEEFLAELAALIRQEGIAKLGVGEMAARLRCSRRRLYDVAQTKEELLLWAARRQFDASLAAGHAAARAEADPARRLVAYLDAGLRPAQQVSAVFLSDLEQSPQGRAIFDGYQLARSEGARAILEEGVRHGAFRQLDFDVVTEMLLGAAQRLRHPAFLARTGLSVIQAFESAYALVLHGLLAEPGNRVPAVARGRASGRRAQQ